RSSLPAKNLKELADLAKAKPGVISYASVGAGSWHHLASERLAKQLGIKLNHVTYRGNGPALNDFVAGNIDMIFSTPPGLTEHAKAGTVRVIATTGETRLSQFPDVPTLSESGITGFNSSQWAALLAPAHTPKAI